jgi:protein SCO1/2
MMEMSKKSWIYISFFTGLVLVFYFVLTALIPDFGKKRIPPISYVRPFSFINQDGKTFTDKDVAGKVYVAEYFFTTCKGICPIMNGNMRKVYERFKDEDNFLILSHTSDPETDSAARLRFFADTMKVNTSRWVFLTGRKDSLYNMARVSYIIDDKENNLTNIKDQFLHTQFWSLVDKNGEVIKVYDGIKESDVAEIISDIAKLLKE